MGDAPKVLTELQDKTVKATTDVPLECDISAGDPVATITWYKDSKELRPGQKLSMTYIDSVASLIINDVGLVDAGNYRCEAVNKIGRVQTDGRLTVQGTLTRSMSNDHCLPSQWLSVVFL